MKRIWQAYISFNRTERMGVLALLIMLTILIGIKATMHLWVPSPTGSAAEQQYAVAWEAFKSKYSARNAESYPPYSKDTIVKTKTVTEKADKSVKEHMKIEEPQVKLFPFDPNTIDSAGLRRLGLREKTAAILLHWRAKGKVFYHKEELKKVYTLTEEDYNRLEPYIIIKNDKKRSAEDAQ